MYPLLFPVGRLLTLLIVIELEAGLFGFELAVPCPRVAVVALSLCPGCVFASDSVLNLGEMGCRATIPK